jgi:hypothetical protein
VRLTRSLCMRQETTQMTHFPGCMRPTEGTRAPRRGLPLCLVGAHSTCVQLLPTCRHAPAALVRALLLSCLSPWPRLLLWYACACTCMWGRHARFTPARSRTAVPERTTSVCTHLPRLVLQYKSFAATYVQNRCNIYKHTVTKKCVWSLQHMQHPDKTPETYVWNSWNIWNIHLQHMCIASATYATSR